MNFILNILRKIRFVINTYRLYLHDAYMYIKYSNGFFTGSTRQRLLDSLIVFYHPLEKGLTMPELRLGFGKDRILTVVGMINLYMKKWGDNNEVITDAIEVIKEYDQLHKKNNFELSENVQSAIDSLLNNYNNVEPSVQPLFSKELFFSHTEAAFPEFAKSRRSIRNYDINQSVPKELILKAIDLSRTSPSTCNRQSVRAHIVDNKGKVQKVLALQSGNRGFGHLVDKVILITSDIQSWNVPGERFSPYLDSGFFAMNLLYALHYYHIGACPLNWSENSDRNYKLHKLLNIPDNEIITMMISCGYPVEVFKVVRSKRKPLSSIVVEHK